MLRRILVSAAILCSLSAPAFAQPAPVPALPDTERRTNYSISSSTCACAVNFALYGDGTDYANWLEVWLNGLNISATDPTFGWTITSPSGPLGNLARPITDAVLTFNNPQTGAVQIVGARRPRQTSQFSENRGVTARDLNVRLTDITAIERELWDRSNDLTGRGLFFAPGITTGPMPQPSACQGNLLGFDATGHNPQCYSAATGTGTVTSTTPTVAGDIATYNNAIGTSLTDTGVSLTSNPQNRVLASPAASTGASSMRALVGADLPNPSASTLGGVQSATAPAHQFMTGITTGGVPAFGQPAVTDAQPTAANTVNGNFTGGSASPAANAMPSCPASGNNRLVYVSGTGFVCGTYAPAASTSQPANPTAPNSNNFFHMMGLAGSITPNTTGSVLIAISGNIVTTSATAGIGITYSINYGTGTAPTNNATATGTVASNTPVYTNPTTVTAANVAVPFAIEAVVTGLTPGTAYWIDLAAKAVTTTSATTFNNLTINAIEN